MIGKLFNGLGKDIIATDSILEQYKLSVNHYREGYRPIIETIIDNDLHEKVDSKAIDEIVSDYKLDDKKDFFKLLLKLSDKLLTYDHITGLEKVMKGMPNTILTTNMSAREAGFYEFVQSAYKYCELVAVLFSKHINDEKQDKFAVFATELGKAMNTINDTDIKKHIEKILDLDPRRIDVTDATEREISELYGDASKFGLLPVSRFDYNPFYILGKVFYNIADKINEFKKKRLEHAQLKLKELILLRDETKDASLDKTIDRYKTLIEKLEKSIERYEAE